MNNPAWWSPAEHARRRPFLAARAQIKTAVRGWFEGQGFTETECGALQVSPGNEAHLHAFATQFVSDDGASQPLFLHTSPEFAMKKLLAAGESRIFDFARAYRNRETGPRHAPEFTMLEWYRTGARLEEVVADAGAIARLAAEATGSAVLAFRGRTCDPAREAEQVTVSEAFEKHAGIVLGGLLDDAPSFRRAAAAAGIGTAEGATWGDIFSAVLVARVEPALGLGRMTVLHAYPICEAALARPEPRDPRFAERFELYACGVELANGYRELTDADVARARQSADMDLKAILYSERYPLDEDFLAAMAVMPDASGVALGFDRLVMLACGAPDLRDVLWTPLPGLAGGTA